MPAETVNVVDKTTGLTTQARQADVTEIDDSAEGEPTNYRDSAYEVKVGSKWQRVATGRFNRQYAGVTHGDAKELVSRPTVIDEE